MNDINKVAETVAEWWADVVCHPIFDNGDNSAKGALGGMLQSMLVKPVESEHKLMFKMKLIDIILDKLTKMEQQNINYTQYVSVDYSPDNTLHECAVASGVNINNFPIKTTMWYSRNHVSVRYGYNSSEKVLYAEKEYYLEKLKNWENTLSRYINKEYTWLNAEENEKGVQDSLKRIEEIKLEVAKFS